MLDFEDKVSQSRMQKKEKKKKHQENTILRAGLG